MIDRQQRTNLPHVFVIGDTRGDPMLAHKATNEAKVAAEMGLGSITGLYIPPKK